jgi:hypothetical protein
VPIYTEPRLDGIKRPRPFCEFATASANARFGYVRVKVLPDRAFELGLALDGPENIRVRRDPLCGRSLRAKLHCSAHGAQVPRHSLQSLQAQPDLLLRLGLALAVEQGAARRMAMTERPAQRTRVAPCSWLRRECTPLSDRQGQHLSHELAERSDALAEGSSQHNLLHSSAFHSANVLKSSQQGTGEPDTTRRMPDRETHDSRSCDRPPHQGVLPWR